MFFNRKKNPEEPQINPEWQPPADPVLQYLLQEAALGWVPVYFAAIPLTRIVRFAPTFRPENTKGGDAVVQSIMQQWQAGEFSKMWVYPRGDQFVVADDYFTLAAAERGQPDLVPCWVLGTIQNKSAEQVQGPIDQGAVAKMLGMK